MGAKFLGNVKFVAKLAHIADANGQYSGMAQIKIARCQERKRPIGNIRVRHTLQNRARLRPTNIDDGKSIGHIPHVDGCWQMFRHPAAIARTKARTGDEVKMVQPHMNQRHVSLNATRLVAKLGVDGFARRPRHIIGRNPLECRLRSCPENFKLGK